MMLLTPDFEACATALVLQRDGMIASTRAILRLDAAMWAGGEVPREDVVRATWRAARDVSAARLRTDDVAFDQARHQLDRALAAYWARRARTTPLQQSPLQVIDPGDRA